MTLTAGRTGHLAWWKTGIEPRLVLLHGFTDDAGCWTPVLPALTGLGDVLAIDARGHGDSGLPDGPVGPDPHAADVAAVLDDLRLGRPVGLVGHSMGAVIAAQVAAVRPDLVSALVLEDPPPNAYGDAAPHGIPDWLIEARGLSRDARIAQCRQQNPAWPEDEFVPWAVSKERFSLDYCARATVPAPQLAEVLGEVRCPALLVYGAPDRGGLITPPQVADLRAAGGDRLTVVPVPDAGHSVHRDDRASYAAALHSWLPTTEPR
ncbi:MAG TPA: alpha/beta hydrolase [Actinocrinis sp.]|nr:alpha/beta hydrolase [Actinocrinis sp.]